MLDRRELEAALVALGRAQRAELRTDDISASVLRSLRVAERPTRPRSISPAVRVAIIAALIVLLIGSAAYAGYRLAFASGSITVHRGSPPKSVTGTRLGLGEAVAADSARLPTGVLLPSVPGARRQPTYWLDRRAQSQVSITFPPEPGLPAVDRSRVGLLIQEFRGDGIETIRKFVTTSTNSQAIRIDGAEAVVLTGGRHTLFYLDRRGHYVVSTGRLAGNTLIFQRDGLTIRVEGELSARRLIQIARSFRARSA